MNSYRLICYIIVHLSRLNYENCFGCPLLFVGEGSLGSSPIRLFVIKSSVKPS